MRTIIKKHITLLIILILTGTGVMSQTNTMYWMKHLPQQRDLNPAKTLDCKFFLDLPVVPNLSFSVNNSGFNINDAFMPHPTAADSFMIDLDGIESALMKKNAVDFETNISLLNFGFATKGNMFFTFGLNIKAFENFQYPKDLIELKNGNYREDGSPVSLNFSQNMIIHREAYIGASKKFFGNLDIGVRLKLLSGYANIKTNKLILDWYTETHTDSMYEWTFVSDIDLRAAAPLDWELQYDSANNISGIGYDKDFIRRPQDHLKKYISPGNLGFAIDLGAEYTLFEKFKFSLSVIDLGFIKWKSNPAVMTQNSTFKFDGVDISDMINPVTAQDSTEQTDYFDELTDTLLTLFNPDVEEIAYTTGLRTKIYAGFDYMVTDWFDLGLMYRGVFADKKLFSAYTASANLNFLKGWSYSVSYSIMDGSFSNIGLGLAYKVGPFQTYFIMDNVAVPVWALNESSFSDKWLRNTKRFNFAFGMNFIICGNKKGDIGLLE